MTRFSSFLVFALGVLLLIVVGVFLVSNVVERWTSRSEPGASPRPELPESDLGALEIEPGAQFHARLDLLYADAGGMEGVTSFVTREFVPGRRLVIGSAHKSEPVMKFLLVDREVRRCDRNGTVLLDEPPMVHRLSYTLRVGEDSTILSWTRPLLDQPFTITVWCVPLPP